MPSSLGEGVTSRRKSSRDYCKKTAFLEVNCETQQALKKEDKVKNSEVFHSPSSEEEKIVCILQMADVTMGTQRNSR